MKPACPALFLRQFLHHLYLATLARSGTDDRLVETSLTVGKHHLIAHRKAEHTQAMPCLLLGQFATHGDVGGIKYVHIILSDVYT